MVMTDEIRVVNGVRYKVQLREIKTRKNTSKLTEVEKRARRREQLRNFRAKDENKTKTKAWNKAYYEKNKEKVLTQQRARRARLRAEKATAEKEHSNHK
jgi:hypothetical protein